MLSVLDDFHVALFTSLAPSLLHIIPSRPPPPARQHKPYERCTNRDSGDVSGVPHAFRWTAGRAASTGGMVRRGPTTTRTAWTGRLLHCLPAATVAPAAAPLATQRLQPAALHLRSAMQTQTSPQGLRTPPPRFTSQVQRQRHLSSTAARSQRITNPGSLNLYVSSPSVHHGDTGVFRRACRV